MTGVVLGLPDTQEHFGDGGDVIDANNMAQAAGHIQVEVALPELDPKIGGTKEFEDLACP